MKNKGLIILSAILGGTLLFLFLSPSVPPPPKPAEAPSPEAPIDYSNPNEV